jgi:hypothetical protein
VSLRQVAHKFEFTESREKSKIDVIFTYPQRDGLTLYLAANFFANPLSSSLPKRANSTPNKAFPGWALHHSVKLWGCQREE